METVDRTLGTFIRFGDLSRIEKRLVEKAWLVANNAYTPRSDFPVGAAILARNEQGRTRIFSGCNVENNFFPPTICAERNAATTALAEGYSQFLTVAVVCKKFPGGSPCGLCRQVLVEFGKHADILNIVDAKNNVRKFGAQELLPAAAEECLPFDRLPLSMKRLVRSLERLAKRSYVPYSRRPRAAIFFASSQRGHERSFAGVSDDNASYGGSALAESVAMRSARSAGFYRNVTLAVTVEDVRAPNPIEGECLQILREFGLSAKVILVGADRSVVMSSILALLPDSFGPESLA